MGNSGFFDTIFERRLGLSEAPSTIVAGPEGGGRLIPPALAEGGVVVGISGCGLSQHLLHLGLDVFSSGIGAQRPRTPHLRSVESNGAHTRHAGRGTKTQRV
jgi:hypothetical protein